MRPPCVLCGRSARQRRRWQRGGGLVRAAGPNGHWPACRATASGRARMPLRRASPRALRAWRMISGGGGDEEEEEDEGYEELRVRFGSAGGGRKTGGRMEHAGNNKCDHHDQRVSLWMCCVTTLTILVRARGGMTLACASLCKAGGDREAGQRRAGEAGRLAGNHTVSPDERCALGG